MNDALEMSSRVAVLGCCELFADAVRSALERSGISVAQAMRLSDDSIDAVRAGADIVVMDAGSAADAIPTVRRLRESSEVRGIVVVVESGEDEEMVSVFEAGASGCIRREASLTQLVRAVRSRHTAVSPRVVARVGDRIHELASELRRGPITSDALTERELQVLRQLARGMSNKDIAHELGVWTHTVKTHLHNIYSKLGVASRREAVTHALRLGLLTRRADDPPPAPAEGVDPIEAAIEAVNVSKARRVTVVHRAMVEIERSLASSEPRSFRTGGSVEELIAAIGGTVHVMEEFTRLAEAVAAADDPGVARAVYKSLTPVIERYAGSQSTPRFDRRDFDYYRFLGHEMLVTLMAMVLGARRFRLAGELVDHRFAIASDSHAPRLATFGAASDLLESLEQLSGKRRVLSMHAELLEGRHTRGPLARLPFDEFVAADYFLFLRGELEPETAPQKRFEWRPWSTAKMHEPPWFLREPLTEELANALRCGDVPALRARLRDRAPRLELLWIAGSWRSPVTMAS